MTLSHDRDGELESLLRPSSPDSAIDTFPTMTPTATRTATAAEEEPLLQAAGDAPSPGPAPSKAFQYKVTILCAVLVFVLDVAVFIMESPFQVIMEDVICHNRYPDHVPRRVHSGPFDKDNHPDFRCKGAAVQKTMAAVRSISMIPQLLCPLLVQVPFGRVADKYGRRLVIRLAILGVTLTISANTLILALPGVFSIWLMVPASLFLLLGGGSTMVTAMVWTMLADVTPAAQRASVYYLLMALALVLSASLTLLSAYLMAYTPWLPMWLGFGVCWLGNVGSFLLPETSPLLLGKAKEDAPAAGTSDRVEEGAPERTPEGANTPPKVTLRGIIATGWSSLSDDAWHIYYFIISSPSIMALSFLVALHNPFLIGMVFFGLEYMTLCFMMSFHEGTYVLAISRYTSVAVLLAGLPLATRLLTLAGVDVPFRRDLYLFRVSALLLLVSCVLFGFAPTRGAMTASQVIYGTSMGYSPQVRALVTALVEPHMLATLNTALATLECVVGVVAAPVVGWLLGRGMDLGFYGLPYLLLSIVAFAILIVAFLIRPPSNKWQMGAA